MTRLHLIASDLHVLDEHEGDVLVLTAFQDQRPLTGLTGRVDWRLCGALSRWFQAGFATGRAKEQVLYPATTRLSHPMVLLIGLGARSQLRTDVAHGIAMETVQAVRKLGGKRMTCDLFGVEQLPMPIDRSVPGLMEILVEQQEVEDVTLAVGPEHYDVVRDLMDSFGRKGLVHPE